MTYTPTDSDIRLIRQAARTLEAEAKALFEISTRGGDWGDDGAAEEDYQTMRTLQARLDALAARMKA